MLIFRACALLLGMTVLLLRGKTVQGFALATFLALTGFFASTMSDPHIGAWWRPAFVAVQGPFTALTMLPLIILLGSLSVQTPLLRRLVITGAIFCCADALYQVVGIAALGGYGLLWAFVDSPNSGGILDAALLLYAILVLIAGLNTVQGADRRRLAVVGSSIIIGEFANFYNVVTTGSYGSGYASWMEILDALSLLIMATGLAYAILVDQLFDIGFVVNRAVVFAMITSIVLPVFIAVEWAVERWAGAIGHVEGVTLEMALAVIIGVSLRWLHRWVDGFADEIIFASRHRSVKALHQFSREAQLIAEPRRLFDATVWTLRTFARVSDCDIMLRSDNATFQSVLHSGRRYHEDDVVVVRLRSSREPVLRAAFPGLVDADVAFPMVVRGVLTGIVLAALPARAEPYSPEEFDALAGMAREIGFSLVAADAAETKHLREENAALRARLLISS